MCRHRIIGHKKVEEAVVIDIRSYYAERLAGIIPNGRRETHIRERAVPIVMEQAARPRLIAFWIAVVRNSVGAAIVFQRLVVFGKMAYVKIQGSIVVVVEPYCAGEESWFIESGLLVTSVKVPLWLLW